MFSLLVLRLGRLNLVLLSMVMVNLLASSMLLTSVLALWHCPLVLEIILQPGVGRQVGFVQLKQVPSSRTEEVQQLEFARRFSYSIDFTSLLGRISERRVVKQKAASRKQLANVK